MIVLLFAALLAQAPMRATLVEGTVTVNGGPLAEGDPLKEGDAVQTAAGGRVEIALPSGTVVRLGESSKMTVGAAQEKAFSARLLLGNLWAKVHKLVAGESFAVETENGVAGVRGTEFRMEVAPGKDDLLRVYEGKVECRAHDRKWVHQIEPGRELRFLKDHSTPAAFDAEHEGHAFARWARERPVKEGHDRLRRFERERRKNR